MDEASVELLSYATGQFRVRPWLFGVARRPSTSGFTAPESPAVTRIEMKPLAPQDAVKMAQLATAQCPLHMHVIEVVAQRSGGNPQFLRDLARSVIATGGVGGLPESAEAAAMAQIDALAPEDRAWVRRAAVFGQTFHRRMLSWFADEGDGTSPGPATWARLQDFFAEEADGYLRFRRSLLRDAAYQGLPYKLQRRLHGAVAARIAQEADDLEEAAGILSLHFIAAGDNRSAWRYATVAGKRAEGIYAYVEAARLYSRALEAGRRLEDVGARDLAAVQRALGDAWYRAAEFKKAGQAYTDARKLVASDPLGDADLLIKLSRVEEKLGKYVKSLNWTDQARTVLQELPGPEAARQRARSGAWYATVLQYAGRTTEALEWAERAVSDAEAAEDLEALGEACWVKGWIYGDLRKGGARASMQRSLEAFERAGNHVRRAGVLMSLAAVCHWEGRWDETLSYLEQARDANVKVGSAIGAPLASTNAAEILIDRGDWKEAESILVETLRFWKASQYRYYLGYCLLLLGRVSLRSGRLDEALSRLEESRAIYLRVGAESEVPAVDARIAECHIAMGNPDAALDRVSSMLARASSSPGMATAVPLLERIRGHALLLKGDLRGARDALETSLGAARERRELFEASLTMHSLIELDRLQGIEPPIEMVNESQSLLARFKVRAAPPLPFVAR